MSTKTGVVKKPKKDNVKVKLRKGRRVLERNISQVESEINKVEEMENALAEENRNVVSKIEAKAKALKELIDKYKNKLCRNVREVYDSNVMELHNLKKVLERDLERYRQDKEKCENGLKKPDGSKSLVNEKKVFQMMYESLDFSEFKLINVQLRKVMFESRKLLEEEKQVTKLIGSIETRIETLNEIKNQIEKVATIECPFKEVTALGWNRETGEEFWACFGADKDLISMNEEGNRLQYISVDFRVDDIAALNEHAVLSTSPDSFCIKRIENFAGDGKRRSRNVVESDIYLHGLTMSIDGAMIVACGTDTPNYAKAKPKTTTIVEFSLQGETLNRIPLQGVTGKVYRIAQNADLNYALTFPKEGRVYSMTRVGEIHGYLSKSQAVKAANSPADTGFWPSGVCCNSKSNIIVSDWKSKRVMLLDANCKFLRYIGEAYKSPNALAINTGMNKLLVGDEGKIEVWNLC